jgi:hypothetical protein
MINIPNIPTYQVDTVIHNTNTYRHIGGGLQVVILKLNTSV